jgi:DNA polymerase-3 subunit epsilon
MRLRRSSLAGPRRRARERAAPGPLRDALAVPLPHADTLTDRLPLLAVDIETTGLDAEQDRVLSIGWVPVDGRDIVLAGARYRIVRPDGDDPVGPSATVHKLTDDDVAAGIPLADAVADLLADLAGRVLLVHFGRIETEFLGRACERLWGAGMPWPVVDTLQLQHRLVTTAWQPDPPAGALRLWTARERYGLPHNGPHHALADALACAELFLAQTAELGHGRPLPLRRLLSR